MQKRTQETRERILTAALKCFSERGFHGARVDTIAARARANKERIYAYFKDKEDLYAEVMRRAFAEITEEEAQVAEELSGHAGDLPAQLVEHYLTLHERRPHLWRLLVWENLEGAKHAEALGKIRRPALKQLRALHAKWSRGREARALSFDAFYYTVTALTFFAFSNRETFTRTSGIDLREPEVRRRLLKACLAMVE